ncbi:MAG TPA: hypothetical protein VEV18_05935, partial [Steroidobacteraceae bacterium]|nr:hypothetical protein [Steroidobacteraceae bacterium]
ESLAHRPGWQIHAQLVFLTADLRSERPAPPRASYRLWFPYVTGDLYGAPGTGDFINATVGANGEIDIDLGATQRDLVRSLEPTEFSLSYLKIEPAAARIARLAPAALQADGIDPIGRAVWVDLDSRESLMLVYADRAARISGHTIARGTSESYDVRFPGAGYVWIAGRESGQAVTYLAVPQPAHLGLAITPLSSSPGGPRSPAPPPQPP